MSKTSCRYEIRRPGFRRSLAPAQRDHIVDGPIVTVTGQIRIQGQRPTSENNTADEVANIILDLLVPSDKNEKVQIHLKSSLYKSDTVTMM